MRRDWFFFFFQLSFVMFLMDLTRCVGCIEKLYKMINVSQILMVQIFFFILLTKNKLYHFIHNNRKIQDRFIFIKYEVALFLFFFAKKI
jgi:glucan phosphoethanolaminetransferase (alkaline phosphatase superfamily)